MVALDRVALGWLLLALALASAWGCATVPGQITASLSAVSSSVAR